MITWAAFIGGSIAAWAVKAVIALGFGVVTIVGFDAVKASLDSAVQGAVGSMPADLYAIMSMAGLIDSIGIWLGAFTTVVSLMVLKRFAQVATTA